MENTKETDDSVDKDEKEGYRAEEARVGHTYLVEKLEDPKEAVVLVEKDKQEGGEIGETKSIAQDNKEGVAGKTETQKILDKTFVKDGIDGYGIEENNPKAQNANDCDVGKTEGSKQTDETVENIVVGNENGERSLQKSQGVTTEIMANIEL